MSPRRQYRTLLFALSLLGAGIGLSGQTIVTYTDLPTFQAAVGSAPMTLEDFTASSHFPIAGTTLNAFTNQPGIGITPGLIQAGVTYSVPAVGTGYYFNIDAGANFTGGFLDTISNGGPLTVTFDAPVSAFGFDTDTFTGASFAITINFTSGPAYSATIPITSVTPVFYGFISNAANIVSLTFGSATTTGAFGLDNFRFTTVPEPSTWVLLGLGAVGFAVTGWWRRRSP